MRWCHVGALIEYHRGIVAGQNINLSSAGRIGSERADGGIMNMLIRGSLPVQVPSRNGLTAFPFY